MLNMPKYIQPMYEVGASFLSPKVKKRVNLIKSYDDFKKAVDIRIYPKEFGGDRELSDILQQFVKKMENFRGEIGQLSDMSIKQPKHINKEWYLNDNSNRLGNGMIGSFRRLNVD